MNLQRLCRKEAQKKKKAGKREKKKKMQRGVYLK